MPDIIIDPEFQALLHPLSDTELATLEESILQEGCRDALVVWNHILLDGHNRYHICQKHGLEFKTVSIECADREAAADWIDRNQLGRRNLTPDAFRLALGRRYNRQKKTKAEAGAKGGASKGQSDPCLTAEKLAAEHAVSPATVKRAGKFAEEVASDPKLQEAIKHKVPVTKMLRAEKKQHKIQELEAVEARPVEEFSGLYDVVVIDPPWPMKKIDRDCRPNQVAFDYPVMSLEAIAEQRPPMADDCHLWMWTTHKFLPAALGILQQWQLKYVCAFVWHKPGGFQPVGLPQYNCEFALYARRGSPVFVDTKQFNVCFDAQRTGHSAKPGEFYDMVRRVTAGKRLDMYNRRAIQGFDGWGNEAHHAGV